MDELYHIIILVQISGPKIYIYIIVLILITKYYCRQCLNNLPINYKIDGRKSPYLSTHCTQIISMHKNKRIRIVLPSTT